ncbi:hypothetical protein NUG13_12065 [Bacillus subtilis]|uniref:Uncharacterized protein n=1 Tax=Bacillus phage vB_BsuS_PJN02 TaxID=2920374 RepID=A0AC61TS35_9CAUD|nr:MULTISPECIES: hypothetical protein [Bacillus subtilis group]YP_010681759.1 hypothetical protein PQE76_gp141 [Bacillus phage vB_BsuS_PJN02]MCR4362064.1 hypothetical protein [Bacillus subtilis]UNH58484.1 hypothetical protein [Bacillus phage vB_BsuS_PJN02]UQB84322.1 hypothetical protein KMZ31_19565 [Bacillus amyloliquefaciens]WOF32957.1 hypothetical protein OEJ84_22800 [Bacillus subtilis]
MKVIKEEIKETEYTVKLTQTEVNTIALALGGSTPDQLKRKAKNYGINNFYIDCYALYRSFAEKIG